MRVRGVLKGEGAAETTAPKCTKEREKVNADTHAPRGGKTDGGEPENLLGRLQRVVLPVKKGP